MELAAAVRARRMVRAYDPARAVPRAAVQRMLELATRAPSAGFSQGWDFVVLSSMTDVEAFWQVTSDPGEPPDSWSIGMRTAPVLVLCLSDRERYLDRYAEPDKGWTDRDPDRWPVPYWDVDVGMAAMIALLSAVDQGLGACLFGVEPRHQAAVLAAFGVPADRRIVGVLSVGYRAPDRRSPSLRRGRRSLAEVVHDGHFGLPFMIEPPG